uniref:Uncharacterized protein n=1 Tax=Oryza glumipatula TaxID=40148 RepID=A0A0D9YH84_9ORYZ
MEDCDSGGKTRRRPERRRQELAPATRGGGYDGWFRKGKGRVNWENEFASSRQTRWCKGFARNTPVREIDDGRWWFDMRRERETELTARLWKKRGGFTGYL